MEEPQVVSVARSRSGLRWGASLTTLALALLVEHATPTVAQNLSVNINFQPATSLVPSGHVADSGRVYADQGNGLSYGWNVSHTSRARAYEPPFPGLNLRYWTLIEMRSASSTSWEIALPNDTYEVTIVAGGPINVGYRQLIEAEGVLVVDDMPGDYNSWVGGTASVTVSDGRLTVRNGSGAIRNWMDFIEIRTL